MLKKTLKQCVAILILTGAISIGVNYARDNSLSLFCNYSSLYEGQICDEGSGLAISLEDAVTMFNERKAVFIDARPRDIFNMGHIAGSRSLPLEQFDAYLSEVLSDITPDTQIITYCDGATCILSETLAKHLIELGYSNVKTLENGYTVWLNNNLPVEESLF